MKHIKKLIYRVFSFGLYVTFFDYLYEMFKNSITVRIKHNAISTWLKKRYKIFIGNIYNQSNVKPTGEIPNQIWICWWDGIENMPPIVKICYNSVLQNAGDFNVTLINKDNFKEYISIPEHIINKLNNKKMTLTHFSNLLRMALLYKYGGLWLDATYFITNKIILKNISFFTIKRYNSWKHIPNGRWAGNCIAGPAGYEFFNFIFTILCEYWKKYNYLITYHLYDYFINLAYDSFPSVKETFDSVDYNNLDNTLVNYLNKEYKPALLEDFSKNNTYHKFTWKTWKYDFQTFTPENKQTLYGFLLEKY